MLRSPRRHRSLAVGALTLLLLAAGGAVTASARPTPSASRAVPPAAVRGPWGHFTEPADTVVVLHQPDGTEARATLTPAEEGGTLEVDGYTVGKDEDGWWRYAEGRTDDGLDLSEATAGVEPPPLGIEPGIGRVDVTVPSPDDVARAQVLRQLQVASRQAQAQATAAGEPRVFRFPVLMLATWFDQAAGETAPTFAKGNDAAHFRTILDGFGGNPRGTLTEFYFENSYGQFLVEVDVFGPYTSARSVQDPCYYGGIDPPEDPLDDLDPVDQVIGVGGGGALGMALEATPQADPEVDFSRYDNDGDGVVDFVGLIHSGGDMAVTGDPCHTWSHALSVTALRQIAEDLVGITTPEELKLGIPTADGVVLDRLFTMPEYDQQGGELAIGVATHEMAHALGEPDYYATDGSSSGDGDWDVMSGGSYLGVPDGTNPTWFNPASRVFQGWTTPTIVRGDRRDIVLQPRSTQPSAGYQADQPNPNLLLVPTRWVKVGQTDSDGHTWTERDVYGLVEDGSRGFVVEGWYLENVSRVPLKAPAIHPEMTRQSYFDRGMYGSGLLTWHFDYWRRSNVLYGANGGQNDPNRMQMDVEEWDRNDNTQEIALNVHRGEPTDVASSAATGITSGTHRNNPSKVDPGGKPQAAIEFASDAPVTPATPYQFEFEVDDNPASKTMVVTAVGRGDCTLQLFHEGEPASESVDSGSAGDAESITISSPEPGTWMAEVGDFAACLDVTGSVKFTGATGFDATGTADTWSNDTEAPTGWAFTNIRAGVAEGLSHAIETNGDGSIRLDVLNLADDVDVSPGFAGPRPDVHSGTGGTSAGRPNPYEVLVFSNGGKAPAAPVGVTVRSGSPSGPIVATGSVRVGKYGSTPFHFSFTPAREGGVDLYTTVDPGGRLTEAHEGNNTQKSTVWAGPANPKVLIVDDDGPNDTEQVYAGALASLGIPYVVVGKHVDAAVMKGFRAVIWVGGIDRDVGQLDERDREQIAAYLKGGGRLWMASNRAMGALTVAGDPQFAAQWFGAVAENTNTFGAAVVQTKDVLGKHSIAIEPFPIRPFLDLLGPAPSGVFGTVTEIATIAKSGKPGADGSGLGLRVRGDAAHGGFRTVTTSFSLAQVDNPAQAVVVARAVMDHLGVPRSQYAVATRDPIIYHSQVRLRAAGEAASVRAIVLGGRAGQPVTLFFRRHGQGGYHGVPMQLTGPGAYRGVIPANAVTPDGVDYFIKAGAASTFEPRAASSGAVAHAIAVPLPEVASPIAVLGAAGAPASTSTPRGEAATGASRGGGETLPATGGDAGVGLLAMVALAVAVAGGAAARRAAATARASG